MGTAKGLTIGIAVGVILAVAFVAAVMSGTFTRSVAAGEMITTPEGKESVLVTDNPLQQAKEPIAVYHNCAAQMLTHEGINTPTARVECWEDGITWTSLDRPSERPIAYFKLFVPEKLKDTNMTCWACKVAIYQYGDNDFELAMQDEVNEKRYPTTRYELPS